MIVEHNESNVIAIGDIQRNQVSIDVNNINHIVTILSSNLYSHPKESFLRETVSNAVDAHTEAGSKEPIILTIHDKYLAIRDYGTGISPERFESIYRNIGSSTKRESNEFIGHFGIGRFSALSCSNLVNITSYYNGRAYYYLMMKDIDKLSIDLINETDTEEANGVEVKIPIKETDVEKYFELLYTLSFIPNIYLNAPNEVYKAKLFNERKIYEYKTFKCCSYESKTSNCKVLVGNILYNIDTSVFREFYDGVYEVAFKNVYPTFSIGELDITPNRENLLYSDRTTKRIKERLKEVQEEFVEMLMNRYGKDYTDLLEYIYYEHYQSRRELDLGSNTVTFYKDLDDIKGTYKGVKITKKLYAVHDFIHSVCYEGIHIIALKNNRTISRGKSIDDSIFRLLKADRYAKKWDKEKLSQFIVVPTAKGFSSKYLNDYLVEYYPNDLVILENPFKDKSLPDIMGMFGSRVVGNERERRLIKWLIKELFITLKDYYIEEDIMSSTSYQEYKKEARLIGLVNQVFEKETVFYMDIPGQYYQTSRKFKSTKDLTTWLTNNHNEKIWAYSIMGDEEISVLKNLGREDIISIYVAKTNKRILENLPKRFIPLSDIVNKKNKGVRTLATSINIAGYKWVDKFIENESKLTSLAYLLPKPEADKIRYFLTKYKAPYDMRTMDMSKIEVSEYDTDLIEGYNACVKYWEILLSMSDLLGYTSINILFAYIGMKKKLFRVNHKTYKQIKQLLNFNK